MENTDKLKVVVWRGGDYKDADVIYVDKYLDRDNIIAEIEKVFGEEGWYSADW